MGQRGPTPKRSDQRRRRNAPERPVKGSPKKAAEGASPASSEPAPPASKTTDPVKHPAASRTWHPVARRWYESLPKSQQAVWYEPSDWATAYLIAESISRELKPQQIYNDEGKLVAEVERPPKGASLAAWLKGMTALLVTEGDRRRLQIEFDPRGAGESQTPATVTDMRSWKQGLNA